jgi:hypothetical protein
MVSVREHVFWISHRNSLGERLRCKQATQYVDCPRTTPGRQSSLQGMAISFVILAVVLSLTASPTTNGLVPTCLHCDDRSQRRSSVVGFEHGRQTGRSAMDWKSRAPNREHQIMLVRLPMAGRDSEDDNGELEKRKTDHPRMVVVWSGLLAQPIVWASLVNVGITGAGLPSGPFGIVGGAEGISYLLLLGWAGAWALRRRNNNNNNNNNNTEREEDDDDDLFSSSSNCQRISLLLLVENLSVLSLVLGLLVVASLVADEGCVPNAKPILDYSAYVPVCEAKLGLFGG